MLTLSLENLFDSIDCSLKTDRRVSGGSALRPLMGDGIAHGCTTSFPKYTTQLDHPPGKFTLKFVCVDMLA